ncbi:hypothetical protein ACFL59_00660 [Planctomycetota bacterium]
MGAKLLPTSCALAAGIGLVLGCGVIRRPPAPPVVPSPVGADAGPAVNAAGLHSTSPEQRPRQRPAVADEEAPARTSEADAVSHADTTFDLYDISAIVCPHLWLGRMDTFGKPVGHVEPAEALLHDPLTADELVELLTGVNGGADQWGGDKLWMDHHRGHLLVRAPPDVHKRIQDGLSGLRNVLPSPWSVQLVYQYLHVSGEVIEDLGVCFQGGTSGPQPLSSTDGPPMPEATLLGRPQRLALLQLVRKTAGTGLAQGYVQVWTLDERRLVAADGETASCLLSSEKDRRDGLQIEATPVIATPHREHVKLDLVVTTAGEADFAAETEPNTERRIGAFVYVPGGESALIRVDPNLPCDTWLLVTVHILCTMDREALIR